MVADDGSTVQYDRGPMVCCRALPTRRYQAAELPARRLLQAESPCRGRSMVVRLACSSAASSLKGEPPTWRMLSREGVAAGVDLGDVCALLAHVRVRFPRLRLLRYAALPILPHNGGCSCSHPRRKDASSRLRPVSSNTSPTLSLSPQRLLHLTMRPSPPAVTVGSSQAIPAPARRRHARWGRFSGQRSAVGAWRP
jgi:hypothetical protein